MRSAFVLKKKTYTEKGTESCVRSWSHNTKLWYYNSMVRYSFFYSAWITGKSFFHWILCNAARMYQKLKECFTESCYIINERPWPCWCWCKTEKNIETSLILRKNPNRVWHLDSYDKFKPFGFEILGCIDGYSRCILRLNILRSNKDPKVVYNVFVNYMKVTKGVPRKVPLFVGRETFL